MAIINATKAKKLDAAAAVDRLLDSLQERWNDEHAPQPSITDLALVALVLQLRERR